MKRRRVGRTGVEVTELGCGGAGLGNLYTAISDEEAQAALGAAWDAGVRYFDTAPHYGLGLSERRFGAALAGRPRSEYVLSTKVGRVLEPNPHPTGSDMAAAGFDVPDDLSRRLDYSADGVRRSLEASLERLGLDRVDIVLVHDPDDHVDQATAEAIPALIALREAGVIGAVGVGMNQWQAPLRMVRETDLDVVMLAGRWTLLDRSGAELMDTCAERGVSVLVAGPFNSGLLTQRWPGADAHFNYAPVPPEVLDRARELARRCERHGVALPHAALHFPLRHPAVASVVAGMTRVEEVRADIEAYGTVIPETLWAEVG